MTLPVPSRPEESEQNDEPTNNDLLKLVYCHWEDEFMRNCHVYVFYMLITAVCLQNLRWQDLCLWKLNKLGDGAYIKYELLSVQFSSVAQLCPTLCDPMNRSTPGLPVHHQLPEFTQTHVHRVGDAIQPWHLLLSPIPPSIRVFSSESTLRMRWPKYWSFSFSISPSNEHPGLISLYNSNSDNLRKF